MCWYIGIEAWDLLDWVLGLADILCSPCVFVRLRRTPLDGSSVSRRMALGIRIGSGGIWSSGQGLGGSCQTRANYLYYVTLLS